MQENPIQTYTQLLEISKINPEVAGNMTRTSFGVGLVDSYEKILELSKINPEVANNMTRTSFGVGIVDSYEKILELSKIHPEVANNMTNTSFGVGLVDSYEKILELSEINPAVANNMTKTQFGRKLMELHEKKIDKEKASVSKSSIFKQELENQSLLQICKEKNPDLSTVQRLLDQGDSVSDVDQDGNTPMHFAASNANIELLKLLIEKCSSCELYINNHQGKAWDIILKETIGDEKFIEFMNENLPYDKPPIRYGYEN